MAVNCFNDTCSVAFSTDAGNKYIADVHLAANGAIVCDDGAGGLKVLIDPASGNLLTEGATGLYAAVTASTVTAYSGNPANAAVGAGAYDTGPQATPTYSYVNSTGHQQLVLVTGEYNYNFGILGPSHTFSYATGTGVKAGTITASSGPTPDLSPYNASVAFRLRANVGAPATTAVATAREDIGGMIFVSVPTSAEQKYARVPFIYPVLVPAGQTLNILAEVFYEGPSQTINVLASPAGGTGLAGTGFAIYNGKFTAINV